MRVELTETCILWLFAAFNQLIVKQVTKCIQPISLFLWHYLILCQGCKRMWLPFPMSTVQMYLRGAQGWKDTKVTRQKKCILSECDVFFNPEKSRLIHFVCVTCWKCCSVGGSTAPWGSWQQWGHPEHISWLFLEDEPATFYQPLLSLPGCPQCGCWLYPPTPATETDQKVKKQLV